MSITEKQRGWDDALKTHKERERIAHTACPQVAYDNGFWKLLTHTSLSKWNDSIKDTIASGSNISQLANAIQG